MSVIEFAKPGVEAYYKLQADELYVAQLVADYAALALEERSIHSVSREVRSDWIYRTTAYLRARFYAWRMRAIEQATGTVLAGMQAGELGALFSTMKAEKQQDLARMLVHIAVGSYMGVLEGTIPLAPGAYLQLREESAREDRR